MLLEVFHELPLGFIAVEKKFLTGSKRQTAHITVRHARGVSDKSDNLQVPLCHGVIVADQDDC